MLLAERGLYSHCYDTVWIRRVSICADYPYRKCKFILETNIYHINCVTAELGDYNQEDHLDGYLSDMRFIPNHTEDFEKEVMELHKQHR